MLLTAYYALMLLLVVVSGRSVLNVQQSDFQDGYDNVKVPVQLGVMSRCPDALLCESVFDQVLKRVSDKADVALFFIATRNSSDPDFGVTCLHGHDECAANIQQLCVAEHASSVDWWEFVQCQNYQGLDSIGQPDVAIKCARSAGIDWEESGVGECIGMDGSAKGREGIRLLKENIQMTEQLGIKKSCTVLINGRAVCVHDGTWKECEGGHTANDFVKQINSEYDRLNNDPLRTLWW